MKKFVACLLLFSLTFSACSHVLPKYQNESKQEFCARINRLTKDKAVSLVMGAGQIIVCKDLQVNPDSTNFREVNSDSLRTIGTNEIISISFYDGERGAWEGLLFGTLIGGTAGLIPNIALRTGTSHPAGNPMLLIYGAIAGAIVGIIYGSYYESKTTIELSN